VIINSFIYFLKYDLFIDILSENNYHFNKNKR